MNLLFDFITIRSKTGAGEYVRTVFFALVNQIKRNSQQNIKIYALYDSSFGIAYDDLTKEASSKWNINIEYIDLNHNNICEIVREYQINRFFIGCAQYLGTYKNIEKISCEIICIIHDMVDEEINHENLDIYTQILNPDYILDERKASFLEHLRYQKKTRSIISLIRSIRKEKWFKPSRTQFIKEQYLKNRHFHLITVSDFSKKSISLHCKIDEKDIKVLYSPEKIFSSKEEVSDKIKNIFKNKKIYLLLDSNRNLKNPYKAIAAFKAFSEIHTDCYLLTVNGPTPSFKNHITLPYLSAPNFKYALENCYALIYPSFFEGFGYPPIEAMHFKKPVLSSYTSSLPEILGSAPIYFSPLFTTSIYQALSELTDENYDSYSQKSAIRYSQIKDKAENDLMQLLNFITEDAHG